MKIGFDGSRAFVDERTGTENYSYQLLLNLCRIDTENRYLIYIRESQESRVKSLEWPSNFQFKVLKPNRLWTQIGLSRATFTDKLDLLFVPSHTLPSVVKPGLKTLLTVHDLGAEYLPQSHQLKQRLYLKFMTYYQLRQATHLIAVSKATKQDIIQKVGIPSEKITVIYEGLNEFTVHSSQFVAKRPNNIYGDKNDIKDSILSKYGLVKNKYFLFVGTIQPRKNLIKLIQAFNLFLQQINEERLKIKDSTQTTKSFIINHPSLFKLVLVGGKGWLSEEIYAEPKRLGIEKQVIFTGRLSDGDVQTLYQNATALTFPSLFEGFGLPILEAFSNNCPVITSNLSSMPEIAGDAAVLVDPKSVEEISSAMIKITKDDKMRDGLIHKGSIRIQLFSWKKCAEETLKVFNRLKIKD